MQGLAPFQTVSSSLLKKGSGVWLVCQVIVHCSMGKIACQDRKVVVQIAEIILVEGAVLDAIQGANNKVESSVLFPVVMFAGNSCNYLIGAKHNIDVFIPAIDPFALAVTQCQIL